MELLYAAEKFIDGKKQIGNKALERDTVDSVLDVIFTVHKGNAEKPKKLMNDRIFELYDKIDQKLGRPLREMNYHPEYHYGVDRAVAKLNASIPKVNSNIPKEVMQGKQQQAKVEVRLPA